MWVRGHDNILKRVLLQTAALNLGLLMRTLCGVGTPRSLQGRPTALIGGLWSLMRLPETLYQTISIIHRPLPSLRGLTRIARIVRWPCLSNPLFTTGC